MNEPTLAILWDVDRTMLDAGPLTRDVLAETIAAVLPGAPADAGPLITGGTDTQVLRDLATAAGADPDAALPALVTEFAARTRASAQQMRAEGRLPPSPAPTSPRSAWTIWYAWRCPASGNWYTTCTVPERCRPCSPATSGPTPN